MKFSNKNIGYNNFYKLCLYDNITINRDIEKNYPFKLYCTMNYVQYDTLIKESKQYGDNIHIAADRYSLSNKYIIRFKNKNNLLKFKLKSSIL